jgi:uncharacterized protein (DUF488 family)
MDKLKIWTIGHSTRSIEEFIALLKENHIRALADVRHFPGSRRYPHFGKAALEASLTKEQIEYVHFLELGGRRRPVPNSPNVFWRNEAFRGYADYMTMEPFREGIARLKLLANQKPTAIMCAEALWWKCHRRMIADFLKTDGWEVTHILGAHKTEMHSSTTENYELKLDAEPN